MILSESAAAATLGLINSIGQLGGSAGPYVIGFLNESNAFAYGQLRIHRISLSWSGKPDSQPESSRSATSPATK
jgi:hypothetical protein